MSGRVRRSPEHFWSLVRKRGDDECWEWTGRQDQSGYGRYWSHPYVSCHRWAFLTLVGPMPEGLQLDHLCRNRLCVNPKRMEPVTSRENTLRGENHVAEQARKTECVNGHPLSEDNVYVWRNHRICRSCRRLRHQDRKRRRRAERKAQR